MTDAPATAEAPWPVALLSSKIKGWIDRLGTVWVEGEIVQWGRGAGGNVFGRLKDLEQDATVPFNVWSSQLARISGEFAQGDRVIALIKPVFWPRNGSLSMNVLQLKHVGLGDLLERIENLRRTLAAEGLFDRERKQRLPFLPHCVGLVTGKDSDAEKDVLRNAQLRWPSVAFRVRHAAVQGDRAVSDVIGAIRSLDRDPEVDVIIVARGGGDFQNLLPFSDERLLRAVAECTTPIVSAIGHENDRPLLDDVADLRASTPTDAAKRVVPDVAEELARVRQAQSRLATRVSALVAHQIDQVQSLRSRPVLADPDRIVQSRAEDVTRLVSSGVQLMDTRLERARAGISELTGQLRALSPERTLRRGYAIARTADGHAVRAAAEATPGTALTITVADGSFPATVDGRRG